MSILRYEKAVPPRLLGAYDLLLRLSYIVAVHLVAIFAWLQGARWLTAYFPRKLFALLGFEAVLAASVLIMGAWVGYPFWRRRAEATGGMWLVAILTAVVQVTIALFGWLVWQLTTTYVD